MGVVGTRLRYGSLLVAVVVLVFWADLAVAPCLVSGLVLAAFALGAQAEFYLMLRSAGMQPAMGLGLLAGGYYLATRLAPAVEWTLRHGTMRPAPQSTFDAGAHLAAAVVLLLVAGVLGRRPEGAPQRIGTTLVGLLVVPFLLGYVIEIRYLGDGWAWVLFLVAVAKSGDSAAFFAGRWLGRHRLIPAVSPNKTWEGSVASLFGSVLAAGLVAHLAFPVAPATWHWLVAAVVVNVGSQFGDLGESLLKRGCGVKDSARLIPVMGGLFDMVDSFLMAAPLLRLYLALAPGS